MTIIFNFLIGGAMSGVPLYVDKDTKNKTDQVT